MFNKSVVKLVPQVLKRSFISHHQNLYCLSQLKLNNGFNTQIKKNFSRISAPKESNPKKCIQSGGNFEDLVRSSSIFVDKSLFIKEIMEDSGKTILITMPRRWGKSLNLDMLRRFLSVEEQNSQQKEFNKKIFEQSIKTNVDKTKSQLNISTTQIEITDENIIGQTKVIDSLVLQGKYPLIFVDFKDCKASSFKEVKEKVRNKVVKTIKQFGYLSNSNQSYENTTVGESYNALLSEMSNNDFSTGLEELTKLLHTYHGKKVWILIDEYDAAANKAYLEFNEEEAKQVSELFRGIYESALKGNDYLEKGVLTGVQNIVKSGMLSGLNNLSEYNIMNHKYSQYYGINQEEMDDLIQHFDMEESQAARIKDWYNGYQENIGADTNKIFIDKYNIWSVINYLNRQNDGFKSYWEESVSVEFIKPLLRQQNFKKKIEDLIKPMELAYSSMRRVAHRMISPNSMLLQCRFSSTSHQPQLYGIATYDALFKYVLSEDTIRPSFFHAFIPGLPIVSSKRLDDHMNPVQGLQLLRTFLHSKKTENVVKKVTPDSGFEVNRKDSATQKLKRDEKATAFLHEMVSRFEDIKIAFPEARFDGTMDFVCQLENNSYALVEMQVIPHNYWDRRALAYVAAFYGNQLFKADEWKDIKKVIGINILGGGKENKAHWVDTPTQFVRHYKVQEQLHNPAGYIDGIELIQYSLMNAPKTSDDQEKQDWITFFKDGHSMTEEQVQQRVKTPEVLEAFKRAKIKSLPAKVLAAYEAEDAEYDRYSEHTEDIAQKRETKGREEGKIEGREEGKIEILMGLIQKGKLTLDDVMQSDDYSPELKAELEKRLPPTNG